MECDLKSEKNSVIIHIPVNEIENINEEEVKENIVNLANKVKLFSDKF